MLTDCITSNYITLKCYPKCPMFYRSLVLWPDSDSALAGNHMWIRAWGGEWSPEFYELPDGPASLPHGHLCTPATTLRPPCHHLRPVHFHGTHHVLPVRQESQEKTTYKHISNTNFSFAHQLVNVSPFLALWRVLSCTYTKLTISILYWKKLSPWSLVPGNGLAAAQYSGEYNQETAPPVDSQKKYHHS